MRNSVRRALSNGLRGLLGTPANGQIAANGISNGHAHVNGNGVDHHSNGSPSSPSPERTFLGMTFRSSDVPYDPGFNSVVDVCGGDNEPFSVTTIITPFADETAGSCHYQLSVGSGDSTAAIELRNNSLGTPPGAGFQPLLALIAQIETSHAWNSLRRQLRDLKGDQVENHPAQALYGDSRRAFMDGDFDQSCAKSMEILLLDGESLSDNRPWTLRFRLSAVALIAHLRDHECLAAVTPPSSDSGLSFYEELYFEFRAAVRLDEMRACLQGLKNLFPYDPTARNSSTCKLVDNRGDSLWYNQQLVPACDILHRAEKLMAAGRHQEVLAVLDELRTCFPFGGENENG